MLIERLLVSSKISSAFCANYLLRLCPGYDLNRSPSKTVTYDGSVYQGLDVSTSLRTSRRQRSNFV